MAGTCRDAADFARDCAAGRNPKGRLALQNEMCWDAVTLCAEFAGVIDHNKFLSLKGKENLLIRTSDPVVTNATAMRSVKAGHILGFYDPRPKYKRFVHAMLSTGTGWAAGTKNGCIGIGYDMAYWQLLNLASGLRWLPQGHFNAAKERNKLRVLHIHHRPITDICFA